MLKKMDKFKQMKLLKRITIVQAVLLVLFAIVFIIIFSIGFKSSTCSDKNKNGITITKSEFGISSHNEKIFKYNLKNANNFEIELISYGAILKSVFLKDKFKNNLNVVLNFDKIEGKIFYCAISF